MHTFLRPIVLLLAAAAAASAAAAPVSLLPANAFDALAASATPHGEISKTGSAEAPVLHAAAPRQTQNQWDFQCALALLGEVRKGDLVRVTFQRRGLAANGNARLVVKLQDKAQQGLLREEIVANAEWTAFDGSFVAAKDYAAGELGLAFFLGLGRQTIEIASLAVDNYGPGVNPAALPPVKAAPASPLPALSLPEAEKDIELPPLDPAAKAATRHLLIKLDDVTAGNAQSGIHPAVRRVTDYLAERGIPASLGVVCDSFERGVPAFAEWIRKNHYRNGGLFDFWQHGWTHQMNIQWQGRTYIAEYAIPDMEYQRRNFDRAQSVFLERTGQPLEGFCAPCGAITDETRALLREHTEIRTWLYGDMKDPCGKFSFRRTCNLESAVGRVEYNPFIRQYRNQRDRDYIMLQGHPAMWNADSFEAFKRIVDQLVADGWTFTTATQFIDIYDAAHPGAAEERAKLAREAALEKAPVDASYFPFPMGGDTPNTGAADLSSMNEKPAGRHGFVSVRDGHFVDGRGRRIRFLATNFTFSSAFPTHEESDAIATRLASLGINCVRLHHMDKHTAPAGIWLNRNGKLDRIDPAQLDRLHYFIAALKKEGVYVDVNLHVSRSHWEGADFSQDGLASDAERAKALPKYAKGIDKINDRMIAMQKDYARDLLAAPNPYTGLPLARDPAVAIVEINNENTIFDIGAADFPKYYRDEIQRKWNEWLRRRYADDAAVRAAWGESIPYGAELITKEAVAEGPKYLSVRPDGPNAVACDLVAKPDQGWMAQLHWKDLTFENGKTYTLSFDIRSDAKRTMRVLTRHQKPEWHGCGLSASVSAGPEWTRFSKTFVAHDCVPGLTRIDIVAGESPVGKFALRNVSLRSGGERGLRNGESLADGTIEPGAKDGGGAPRDQDWTRFLGETERAYVDAMKAYIRDELGCKAPVIDSQASYGGLVGLYREARNDFVDMHSYWQHPSFPGTAWDPGNWSIRNTPMSAEPEFGANLAKLANYRVAGKPFTVSEYDHAAPSSYSAEMFPMIASFAAAQDWDGIFQFDWGGTKKAHFIDSYFSLKNHPAKLAFLPAAAWLFRRGDVPPLAAATRLDVPAEDVDGRAARDGRDVPSLWRRAGVNPADAVRRRFELSFGDRPASESVTVAETGDVSASRALSWSKGEPYRVDTFASKVLVGDVGGRDFRLRDLDVSFAKNPSGFAAMAACCVDGRPMPRSKRILVTLAGDVQNTNMGWNERHTSVGRKWGEAPTVCEGISATFRVRTESTAGKVYALDGKGARKGEVACTLADGVLRFAASPAAQTLWYEIEFE